MSRVFYWWTVGESNPPCALGAIPDKRPQMVDTMGVEPIYTAISGPK